MKLSIYLKLFLIIFYCIKKPVANGLQQVIYFSLNYNPLIVKPIEKGLIGAATASLNILVTWYCPYNEK